LIKTALIFALATVSLAATLRTNAEIHKCTDDDGNVAYLQLPCPAKAAEPIEPTAADEGAEVEEPAAPESVEPVPLPSSRQPGEPLAACKKRYRDQIDAVEAELFATDVATQGEAYKERLLALAQQLRACG